jgi:hypothetical protein
MHVWALKIKTYPITHNVNSHDKNKSSLCIREIQRSTPRSQQMLPLNPPRSKQTPIIHIVSSQDQKNFMLCMCELPKSRLTSFLISEFPRRQSPLMHVWAPKIKTDHHSPFLNSQDQKKPPICTCELPRLDKIKSPFCIFEPQYQTNPNYVCTSSKDKSKPLFCIGSKMLKTNARRKFTKWKKFCNF